MESGVGSNYPWYKKPKKYKEIAEANEAKRLKELKKVANNKEGLKKINKKIRSQLKEMSLQSHCRRVYEANKDPDCDETYEEFIERKLKQRRAKLARQEDAERAKREEEAEERKFEEQEKKYKEGKGGKIKTWPGSYPCSVTQDFITMLKYIIEAEYETNYSKKKGKEVKIKSSKKNKIVKEFSSFLTVLFTANEMMRRGGEDSKSKSDEGSKGVSEGKAESSEGEKVEEKAETEGEMEEGAEETLAEVEAE